MDIERELAQLDAYMAVASPEEAAVMQRMMTEMQKQLTAHITSIFITGTVEMLSVVASAAPSSQQQKFVKALDASGAR